MTAAELRKYLMGRASTAKTSEFLSDHFIPEVVKRLNDVGTRRRMALYGGDRVPENERNLTDVRNRMSLLIEYKLAWTGNDILEEVGIDDVFWTNVVANRFPDLEVRDLKGARGVRIEVKCLEAIAEEKSANFDTLKKDINPNTDFVAVFVWEWFRDKAAIAWDRAPKILRAFIFHASSLAELRDFNWLSNPPGDLGGGFQGYDLRYAVNCRNGVYNEEEGNYGKLLRIWKDDAKYTGPITPLIQKTINLHGEFEDFVLWSGFEVLSGELLSSVPGNSVTAIKDGDTTAGFCKGNLGIIFKRRANAQEKQKQIAAKNGLKRMIIMTDKYQWIDIGVEENSLRRLVDGKKPKHLLTHLSRN
jgi:hypothetical protein